MFKITEKDWINPKYIKSVIEGFTEIVKIEKEIHEEDLEVIAKIESLQEKLQEDCRIPVKSTEKYIDEDGAEAEKDIEDFITRKLIDVSPEDSGDTGLYQKKIDIEQKIAKLQEKVNIVKTEVTEEEVTTEGYTVEMVDGSKYDVKENPFKDYVRDYILVASGK